MEITFPPTFFWGIASAAHQVEGGNVYNDNWVQGTFLALPMSSPRATPASTITVIARISAYSLS